MMLGLHRSGASACTQRPVHSRPACWPPLRELQRHNRHICRVSQQLVLLEKAVLADWTTEQLQQHLEKLGVHVANEDEEATQEGKRQQQPRQQPAGQQGRTQHRPSAQQPPKQQKNQQQQQPQQQQPQQQQQQDVLQEHAAARAKHVAASQSRRQLLLSRLAAARVAARARVVRLPLRLTIAGRAGSRRYLTVPVDMEGVGFVDFLLDCSSYLSRITPRLRNRLGLGPADGVAVVTNSKGSSSSSSGSGSSSGGGGSGGSGGGGGGSGGSGGKAAATSSGSGSSRWRLRQRVPLPDMWLGTAKLPKQQAFVSSLLLPPRQQQQQQQYSSSSSTIKESPVAASAAAGASAAAAVGGVLGVQVLRSFEVDIDVAGNMLALHPASHVELGLANVAGLTPVPCRFTKTGAIVLPVSLAGSPPFTGLLDLSASTSMLNWEAAALLGMTCTQQQQQEEQEQEQHQQHQPQRQPQQQQQQQPPPVVKSMYGYFGSIEVVPDELLKRPQLPQSHPHHHPQQQQQQQQQLPMHHAGTSHQQQQQQQQQQHLLDQENAGRQQQPGESASASQVPAGSAAPELPLQLHLPDRSSSSSSSNAPSSNTGSSSFVSWSGAVDNTGAAGGAGSSSSSSSSIRHSVTGSNSSSSMFANSHSSSSVGDGFSPLRVQKHQVAASQVKLVLGHARLAAANAAAAAADNKSSSSSSSATTSSSSSCSLALMPPQRLGVAGLRGLGQLGLSGQPVMVVGADIWARQRAVLCLKAGWLYLVDRPAQAWQQQQQQRQQGPGSSNNQQHKG